MTVATTIAALQTIHLTITGVNSAPTTMPSNLDQVKKPTVLVFPAEATWNMAAIDLRRQERVYEVRCYVQPVGQGLTGVDDGYQKTVTLLERFGQKYLTDITLGGSVDTMRALADSGVRGGEGLVWADVGWWGFVYRITVVEKSS